MSPRAGLRAMVGVFAGIPPAKLCKIRVHAPVVLQVAGGMDDAEEAIQSLARRGGWFNGEAFVNPYVLEGEKTISYELAIQSGWDPPEAVAFPLGSAACLIASYKGFQELQAIGCIAKMPRLIGVQFSACAPIAKAFEEGHAHITRFHRTPIFSTTLMHEKPLAGELALRVIQETGGMALAVTDDGVRSAMGLLGRAGIFAEPAGAISLAGAMHLRQEGRLEGDLRVVCLVSGNGLNYIEAAQQGGKLTGPMSLEAIHAMTPEGLLG
jgi:threonine synthase